MSNTETMPKIQHNKRPREDHIDEYDEMRIYKKRRIDETSKLIFTEPVKRQRSCSMDIDEERFDKKKIRIEDAESIKQTRQMEESREMIKRLHALMYL